MIVEKLKDNFKGSGEVSGFNFQLVHRGKQALLYKVDSMGSFHYETFKIQVVKKCIDFDEKIYSETELKEVYPKSGKFGVTAWSYKSKNKALNKFMNLNGIA